MWAKLFISSLSVSKSSAAFAAENKKKSIKSLVKVSIYEILENEFFEKLFGCVYIVYKFMHKIDAHMYSHALFFRESGDMVRKNSKIVVSFGT